jgi:predicted Rossmann fold flavoprotein
MKKIVVIGGGAAGMMAAGTAAASGNEVTLFEKNKYLGKKLRITGKGRCNVTNRCSREELMSNMTRNGTFLYGAFARFGPEDTIRFFEELGVALKTERGNRVFPVSDKAEDIVNALAGYCRTNHVKVRHESVTGLKLENGRVAGVFTCDHKLTTADSVILATGGKSYPMTGSTGDGYRFAQSAGHTTTKLIPSLVPLNAKGDICQRMQGLSLKNIQIRLLDGEGSLIFSDFGEMLFTHFGLSGPVILSASAHMRASTRYRLEIDLKPGLDEETLDRRLIRDFEKYAKKFFINSLDNLLPQKMIPVVAEMTGIDFQKKVSMIPRQERMALLHILKAFPVEIDSMRSIDEAIVTSGGIACGEINPRTMESRLVEGLYFAGELIDVDAYTGGFNLQIAFSTGYLAGQNA